MLSIKRVVPAKTAIQAMCLGKSDQLSLFLRLLASAISKYSRTKSSSFLKAFSTQDRSSETEVFCATLNSQ